MRYPAAEKLEIIRLVEQSSLSVRRTLGQLGIPRSTFYAWYERYLARGAGALEDGQPAPRRVWNKLPDTVAEALLRSPSANHHPREPQATAGSGLRSILKAGAMRQPSRRGR